MARLKLTHSDTSRPSIIALRKVHSITSRHLARFASLTWNPITTAPLDADLELCVFDGEEHVPLEFPSRRNGVAWSDVRLNRICQSDRPTGGFGNTSPRDNILPSHHLVRRSERVAIGKQADFERTP
jgi:hypothetical protein